MKNKLIYVVDDEPNIRELVKSYLNKEGYEVQVFADGESAYQSFVQKPADMLVLDIMMPGMDGYSLCREIRKTSDVPIIMVSAKDDEIDRILGLELGSDDYISKPFSPRELVVRVKTIFRRIKDDSLQEDAQRSEIRCHDISVLPDERRVLKEQTEIELTTKEFEFLAYLIKNKNRVFTREHLITNIWGYDYVGDTRAIDDLVKRIRKKLAEVDSRLEITTVWGYGYKISE
ncbi:MAG: response regulator transcription factor [Clostridia bacterium]|nr:response regulator transcription factor [Clostridia bacterium]